MFKKTTDQKSKSQTETQEPIDLNDSELELVRGARRTAEVADPPRIQDTIVVPF